jgi:integrase
MISASRFRIGPQKRRLWSGPQSAADTHDFAMPKALLSQSFIDGFLERGEYHDAELAGFSIRVTQTRRTYYVRAYDRGGRRPRVKLGHARTATRAGLSYKEAHALAAGRLKRHADGKTIKPPLGLALDPIALAQLDAETITVEQLVGLFLASPLAAKWSDAHRANSEFFARRIVVPTFGAQLARTLSRRQVKTLEASYALRAPINVNRLHAFLSKLCRWAVREEWLEVNPIDQLEKPGDAEESRDRELAPAELRALWAALDAIDADPKATPKARASAGIWRLRLLTAQRETPLRRCQWSWVRLEDKVIDVPAEFMKGKKGSRRPHLIPLGARALAVLEARRLAASPLDVFVFGSRVGTTKAPGRGRTVPLELPDFQGKDLRRTAASLMGAHGINPFVIARVLAHKDNSITGIYNRYQYLAEKRVALETLDRVLTTILEPEKTQTETPVLPFTAHA